MSSARLPQRFAYAAAGLLVAGTVFVVRHHHLPGFKPPFEAGHMPSCDSSTVRHLVQQSIEQSPDAQAESLKVLKVGSVADTTAAMDADQIKARPDRRQCVADVFTNAGRELVLFTIDWSGEAKDEIYLEIPELPF